MTLSRTLSLAAAAGVVALGGLAVPSSAMPLPAGSSASAVSTPIVGTWRMSIDPDGPPPAFPSLISFNLGQTIDEAVSSIPPAMAQLGADDVSSGLGAWRRSGRSVAFTFEKFFTDGGVLVARQTVTGTTTVSPDGSTQSGPATAAFYAPDGTQIGPTLTVQATGTRLVP